MKINPSTTLRIDGERSRTIKVAPSILSADFSCLGREIREVEIAGADMLHIDVMDGHFVPNISIGPAVVKYIRRVSKLPLDVHLMIEKPEKFIDDFISAGSDMLTVHIEAISNSKFNPSINSGLTSSEVEWVKIQKSKLKRKGIKLGISLNPATPLARIKEVLNFIDFVLVMSVNPGFSGQAFIYESLSKIKQLRSIYNGDITVDGGINEKTAKLAINAGASILAAGSYVFGAKNIRLSIERLRNAGRD